MGGRDSKKGGRQNGFCRPRVKEPQLRSLRYGEQVPGKCYFCRHLPEGNPRWAAGTAKKEGGRTDSVALALRSRNCVACHGICLTVGQIAAGRTRMPHSTTAGRG